MDLIGVFFPPTQDHHTYTQSRRLPHWAISVIDVIYKGAFINVGSVY